MKTLVQNPFVRDIAALTFVLPLALIACSSDDDNKTATTAPTAPTAPVAPSLAAPMLADISGTKTLTEDEAVVAGDGLRFVNSGGGALTECTVSPALPAGLNLAPTSDKMHCEITGTPSASQASTEYTVTATNATGMEAGKFRLVVESAPPLAEPALANIAVARTLTVGAAIVAGDGLSFPNPGGRALTGCTVSPALPAGLSVGATSDKSTCEITGTPGAAATATAHTVTATNAIGTNTATVMLAATAAAGGTPNLPAPRILDIGGTTTLITGAAVTAGDGLRFPNPGGRALTGCTINFDLPAGLDISVSSDMTTCEITGTPTAVKAFVEYTVIAANATGTGGAVIRIIVDKPPVVPSTTLSAPSTGARGVIGSAGLVSPNQIVITTTVNGTFSDIVNTSVAGSATGASPKMQWTLGTGAEAGEVSVSILGPIGGAALFTTQFSAPGANPAVAIDHSSFAGGNIVFELSSADWGAYGASGTTNGMVMKIDHTAGQGSCACDTPLDVSGLGADQWGQFSVPVDDLVEGKGLELDKVRTGIVLFPDLDLQGRAGPPVLLTFKIRNVRWEPAGN